MRECGATTEYFYLDRTNKKRLAIMTPFLISACGTVLLGWMGRAIKSLFGIMFTVILPELIYATAVLIAELAGKGKYFVVYKREGGGFCMK